MTTAKPQHRAGLYRVFLAAMVCAFGLFLSPPASAQMDSDFSAGGAVRIGDSTTTCNASATGALRYNSAGLSVSYCNGSAWTVIGSGQSFLSLSDTPASYAGAAGYFLKVNAATNAVEFTNQLVTSGTGATPVGMLLDNLDDVVITTPTNGQSLTYNGTNWVNSSGGGGGTPAGATREIQFNSGGAFAADAGLVFSSTGDFMASGTYTGTASVPASGAGTRMFFDTQMAAFRVGNAYGTEWDNASIGAGSVAMGGGTTASGAASMATGTGSVASGDYTTAMGFGATASGDYSTAIGNTPTASGQSSVSLGASTVASGSSAMAMGNQTIASGDGSLALGTFVKAGNGVAASGLGDYSIAIGLPPAVWIPAANYPQVTGSSSFGIFMQDQQSRVFSASNTLGLFGGKMIIDSATPATYMAAPTYNLSFSGDTAAQSIGMERETTNTVAGRNLTINAGGADAGSTDLAGGNLVLQSGMATGNGASSILFQTVVANQGSAATDRAPATSMTLASNALTIPTGATTQEPGQAGMQAAANGMVRYDTTTNKFRAYQNGAWVDMVGGGGAALSAITAATSTPAALANSTYIQTWNWALTAAAADAFTFGETTAATGGSGGQSILKATTLAASTAIPLMVTNLGNGLSLRVNDDTSDTDTTPFVVDASGQVGVGTASPVAKLDVEGAVQIGNNAETCTSAADLGSMRFSGSAFEICRDFSTGWEPLVGAGAGGVCGTTQTYSTVGTHNYVVPPTFGTITVKVWGAGGGGGGAGGSSITNGGTGGSSTIASLALSASGGGGGITSTGAAGAGGSGGTASGGDVNTAGAAGDAAVNGVNSGAGGTAPGIGGGAGGLGRSIASNGNGNIGGTPGGGGGGAMSAGSVEGGGGGSGAYVEKTYTQVTLIPGTTINDIVVGVGGTAGDSSTNDGGVGGTGRVTVTCASAGAPLPGADNEIAFFSSGNLSSNTNFVFAGGNLGIGTASPAATLDITATDAIILPRGTTAQAPGTPVNGMIRYDTTLGKFRVYQAGAWADMIGGGGGSIDGLSDGITDYVTDMTLGLGDTALDSNTTGAGNTAVGINALTANTTGDKNTAVGYKALESNISGIMNTALGHSALKAGGSNNVAIGYLALLVNTGQYNTAIGTQAMEGNIVGQQNTALGQGALYSTNASNNTGVGTNALYSNVAKTESTAVGYNAMYYADSTATGAVSYNTALGAYALMGSTTAANNTGVENTVVGHSALTNNTSGFRNVALGVNALSTNAARQENTAIGFEAMRYANSSSSAFTPDWKYGNTAVGAFAMRGSTIAANNTGEENTALGAESMMNITSGGWNTAAGGGALMQLTTGNYNTAMGNNASAQLSTGQFNTSMGYSALGAATGSYNTAVGYRTLKSTTTGEPNTAMGYMAMDENTIGGNNTALGMMVANTNIAGSEFVAIGHEAMRYANSAGGAFTTYNTAIGAFALRGSTTASANTGTRNTAIGHSALMANTSGGSNNAIGYLSLSSNTTGSWNTALGDFALPNNTIGNGNTAIGEDTLQDNVSGNSNTAVGSTSLQLASGSNNTALGASAGANITTGSSNIIVGASVNALSATADSQLNIGNTIYGDMANDGLRIGGAGAVSAFSDLELAGTLALKVSSGTTAQAPGTPANGMIRYDTTLNKFRAYQAGAWTDMIGGGGGSLDALSDAKTDYLIDYNLLIGTPADAYAIAATGTYNLALGQLAGDSITSGDNNIAIGYNALSAVTTAGYNVAIGKDALALNTSGADNVAIGDNSSSANTVGYGNVSIGSGSMSTNTRKSRNTAIGALAMEKANNAAVAANTDNTAVGWSALQGSATAANNTGINNTAVGAAALYKNTSGTDNIAVGLAMRENTTGSSNAALGNWALGSNTIGSENTAIGWQALTNNKAAIGSTAIGANAMGNANDTVTGFTSYNTAVGSYALQGSATPASNTGTGNTAIGHGAMDVITTASSNVAVGVSALGAATTTTGSVAVGYEALLTNVTGNGSTAVGYQALRASQSGGIDNTALGYQALLRNTTGDYNNAMGRAALEWNTTGSANMAIGSSALGANATGSNNVAVGVDALGSVNAGNNTGIGYQAGFAGTAITTGTNNTFIGYQAQADANNYTNGTALGNGAILTASNRIVLGNASIASIYAQVTTITGISDRRHKKDIEDIDLGLEFISKLKPVAYRFNNGDETLRYGFIAQDIEMALSPELQKMAETTDQEHGLALLSRENNDERTYRVNYGELTGPMVKAIQEQQAIIDTQRIRIEDQEARLDKLSKDLDSKMASFEKDLKGLKAHTGYDINKAGMEYWMLLLMVGLFGAFSATFVIGTVIRTRKS